MLAEDAQYKSCYQNKLSSELDVVNKKIGLINEIVSGDFLPLKHYLPLYKINSTHHGDSTSKEIKTGVGGADVSINELIKDMQFHDVVHQKLDHIVTINGKIKHEFLQPSASAKLAILIAVNQMQLWVLHAEYGAAIENLKRVLALLNNRISEEARPYLAYNFHNVELLTCLIETISTTLGSLMQYNTDEMVDAAVLNEWTETIQQLYTMESEREVMQKAIHCVQQNMSAAQMKESILNDLKKGMESKVELFE